jgi:NADH dehydrogenase FAD-containing subunit
MHRTSSTRRTLIGAGLATAGVALAGCAAAPKAKGPRVVVLGGGWGGIGAARALAEARGAQVTLIEANPGFMSCPMSSHFVAGFTRAEDYQRTYARLDAAGVRRVQAVATEIDRAAAVVVAGGQRYGYDFLVLSPGVEYIEDGIKGYAQARAQLPVGFRAFEQQAVREQVDRFLERGGNFIVAVPRPPYRCPPAPYERALLIADQAKRRGTKGKVIVVDANPTPLPAPIAAPLQAAMQSEYPGLLEYQPSTEITAVDAGRRVLSTSMGDLDYSGINLVLPMRAPALIRQAGLGERWAPVRLPTFQAEADDKIYVIGDATGTPLPKSGHLAFFAGQRVAADILRRAEGRPAPAVAGTVSLPDAICWAYVNRDEAIGIKVVSTLDPGKPPVVRVTVDPKHSLASGQAGRNWGQSMWTAMLG